MTRSTTLIQQEDPEEFGKAVQNALNVKDSIVESVSHAHSMVINPGQGIVHCYTAIIVLRISE